MPTWGQEGAKAILLLLLSPHSQSCLEEKKEGELGGNFSL